jgi:hypothetical protein
MPFFTNDQQLADEYNDPGTQAAQPLSRPNIGQSSLSSTDVLNDPYGLGGLPNQLRQLTDTNTGTPYTGNALDSGLFTGYSNVGHSFNASSSPNTAITNNQLRTNNQLSSGSSSFTNSGMGGASNSNNILSYLSENSDGSYNNDFFSDFGQQKGGDYFAPNNAFNFGNNALLGGTPGSINLLNELANASGNGNQNVNNILNLLNATPNSLIDTYSRKSGNEWAGFLNDDWSQRGIINKAANALSPKWGGVISGAIDYSQGKNDWGALGQGIAIAAGATPLGMFGGYLLGDYLGGKYGNQYNSNLDDNSSDFAKAQGFEVGTKAFDDAIKAYKDALNNIGETQDPSGVEIVDKPIGSGTLTDIFGNSWGSIDTSEGTLAGDYAEAGFTAEDTSFATSFDSSGWSSADESSYASDVGVSDY